MYAFPVLLPAVSNREDLLLTLGLFDDDTGDAIELSGRTLANPGDFTASVWTVTDGAIITNSTTQLTIPDFPIGDELEAVSLTVGDNLNILAGDPITIADPTGLNTMTGYVVSYAPATGALVVLVSCLFEFEIRGGHSGHGDGYTASYDIGGWGGTGPIILANLGNGITIIGTGVVQVRIPAADLYKFHYTRTCRVGMNMFDGQDTRQVFIGELPITRGIGSGQFTSPIPAPNPYGLP
jgi:hypothetical protein